MRCLVLFHVNAFRLASGLPVLVSGPTVSLGVIVGHRFGGRFMFFSEPLVHKSYLVRAQGC
jgi:hypothetical protein